jgi:hypothetical protein
MKHIRQYITETIREGDKNIIDMLNFFAKNCSGVQQELFNQKVKDANSVDIVPLSEVFTEEEIKEIKRRIHPQPKCCYENAWKLCDRFEYEDKHEIKYCEGYLNMKGLPIEHAFNCVDGKYVDITVELALNRPIEDTYITIGEYSTDEVREILIQNEYYGDIYNTIFLNKYKENIKAA